MIPDDLERILRSGDDQRRDRTLACPAEQQIAAFADGLLGPDDRARIAQHLADCGHCLALVGLLGREQDAGSAEPVPETVLATARRLKGDPDRGWARSLPRWAAAAGVLLAIPIVLQLIGPPGNVSETSSAPEARIKRGSTTGARALDVLQPAAGATVDADALSFRWTAVPDSEYYDLRIVTDAGALVVEQRVTGTEWRPDQPLGLDRGADYFVHVDAYPAEGKALGSVHVPFRTAE
jgi:hypothetical protein